MHTTANRWTRYASVLMVTGAVAWAAAGATAPPAAKTEEAKAFEAGLRSELGELATRFSTSTRPADLAPTVDALFDTAIAYCSPADDTSPLADIDALRRQIVQLSQLKGDDAAATTKLMTANPQLARVVASAIGPQDNVAGAYAVLRLLAEKFPARVLDGEAVSPADAKARTPGKKKDESLATLVAAFCIVYDGPVAAAGATSEPVAIPRERITKLFEHFATNQSKMSMRGGAPPEVLAYVVSVDPRVTDEDLPWALSAYAGHKSVGKLYQSIVYDTNHFKRGTPKKVDKAPGGVTLQNVRKFGGICAEQAFFAANVGKLIGVPTVVVIGRGSDVGHAWVGYLKSVGNGKHEWDFDEGRYKEYQGLRGNAIDPRTGDEVADGVVGLSAGLMTDNRLRHHSIALLDAAERMQSIENAKLAYPPTRPSAAAPPPPTVTPRPLGSLSQLELIEEALRKLPANTRGWNMVATMAGARRLTPEQLRTWSERVIELCGNDHPDFAFEALVPMTRAVPDATQQDSIWEWLAGRFTRRKDLAAASILARADMWEKFKTPAKAWDYYNDVIERYPNDGQIIIDALARADRFLVKQNKSGEIVELYDKAWHRITKPSQTSSQFTAASTYVVVGKSYAALLEKAGKPSDAKRVRDQIKQVMDR